MKKCFKCENVKEFKEFYKHSQMSNGYLNKCKNCCKIESNKNFSEKMKDPLFKENEKTRGREKYHRLNYKESIKRNYQITINYRKKYPEKARAVSKMNKSLKSKDGFNYHHWNYNIESALDIIELSIKDHMKAHRFIIYDQERFMFRRYDNNELLDTKEKHLKFITEMILTKED